MWTVIFVVLAIYAMLSTFIAYAFITSSSELYRLYMKAEDDAMVLRAMLASMQPQRTAIIIEGNFRRH